MGALRSKENTLSNRLVNDAYGAKSETLRKPTGNVPNTVYTSTDLSEMKTE